MPTYYSAEDVTYIFFGATQLQLVTNEMRMKVSAVLADTRVFGETFPTVTDTGLRNGELELSGYYDGVRSDLWLTGDSDYVTALIEGNTVSKRAYAFDNATVESTEISMGADQPHRHAGTFKVSGRVYHGWLAAPYAARTTAGNTQSAYADMGADGTTGYGYLVIGAIDLGGYTNVIVTVQHSNDHVTWGDHTAFAARTAVGASKVALATAIEQYLAISWAYTGAGTGPTWTGCVVVGKD
jgi:hypothetical protein